MRFLPLVSNLLLLLLRKAGVVSHSETVWTPFHVLGVNKRNFRGDNVYVWQAREHSNADFIDSYIYARSHDQIEYFRKSKEDQSFGVYCFEFEGRVLSRDLIDSCLELNFLCENIPGFVNNSLNILDVGAGYGRLAKRIIENFEDKTVYCADAILKSSNFCQLYLAKEIRESRAHIISPKLSDYSGIPSQYLAVNIHSWPETSLTWIKKWLDRLKELKVEYLFVVPNGPALCLNDGTDFSFLVIDSGFELVRSESKFGKAAEGNFGIYPTNYYLFKRKV